MNGLNNGGEIMTANINSDMYQRGYDNIAVCFSYIPDFKTEQDKIDYTAGSKKAMEDEKK